MANTDFLGYNSNTGAPSARRQWAFKCRAVNDVTIFYISQRIRILAGFFVDGSGIEKHLEIYEDGGGTNVGALLATTGSYLGALSDDFNTLVELTQPVYLSAGTTFWYMFRSNYTYPATADRIQIRAEGPGDWFSDYASVHVNDPTLTTSTIHYINSFDSSPPQNIDLISAGWTASSANNQDVEIAVGFAGGLGDLTNFAWETFKV